MSQHVDPFIALSTGGKFYPLGPDPDRIDIRDIAHSLSQQCRYAGHTSAFWSVAAHSLEVSRRVVEKYCYSKSAPEFSGVAVAVLGLEALLHDASEAYLQDIVRPVKPLVHGYAMWEANVERAIAQRFKLAHPWADCVKEVDDAIVLDEVANFFAPGSAAWARYDIRRREDYYTLIPLEPREAEQMFLDRFTDLQRRIG